MSIGLVGVGRVLVAAATLFAVGHAVPAYASGGTYNDAAVDIHGGNAAAFSSCLNYAKLSAKHNRAPQSNACRSFAHASGGAVELSSVSMFVDQEGHGRTTRNNVDISISGGDAVAVADCVNYLDGTATPGQVESCKSAADARGGSVKLDHVDITIIQIGA